MKHGLRAYWRKCRCSICKEANAAYWRRYHFGKRSNPYVPVKKARQLLLSFDSTHDASRVTGISQPVVWRIVTGQTKKIRRSTEQKILLAA